MKTRYTITAQTVMSHLFLRILCLLILEYDCARLVQKSSGSPAVLGNYLLSSLFALGLLTCLVFPKMKLGYLVGLCAGSINVIAKVVIIFKGHEHYPFYPFVWIPQNLIIIYFCYMALKEISSPVTNQQTGD